MSGEEKEYTVKVTRIDGYRFEVDFGLGGAAKLLVDEDPPLGRNEGPDPSRLLAASMIHCTLSSLLFCMEKSKAKVNGLEASAKIRFGRDEDKRLRIIGIDMVANVSVPKGDKARLERCKSIFQDYCTVTQSVKKGIPMSTEIKLTEDGD
jgi:uncharacterized OsmC-like protein